MKIIKTEEAEGHILCHDITQIIKGVTKDAVFRKGHVVQKEDIPVLLSVGKDHLYVWENDETKLHEDDAARVLLSLSADDEESLIPGEVKEGKIELKAGYDGLFKVDSNKLRKLNSLGEMMIASRHGNTPVKKGDKLAGMRVIPLVIEKEKMERAKETCKGGAIFHLLPYRKRKCALITTGNEVFHHRIEDTFSPVIEAKLAEFGCGISFRQTCPDDPQVITEAIKKALDERAELVICTGGMSVDPDDKTPLAIKNSGVRVVTYGAPVLPGAMLMLSYAENGACVVGLPGCVMYARRTVFDLILPRIMADDAVSFEELAALGEGGLCLGCEVCRYPDCSLGKTTAF
ncbi:MAG: molybdopterin-binding protein [Lachnospiraceae bacterium]|nr:molybdopterin-binding protein [Lachnospiraceae bacterium]